VNERLPSVDTIAAATGISSLPTDKNDGSERLWKSRLPRRWQTGPNISDAGILPSSKIPTTAAWASPMTILLDHSVAKIAGAAIYCTVCPGLKDAGIIEFM
jgi:hypothetical protein